MSRTPARYTQADIARAQKVAELATKRGAPTIVEMAPDGTIRLVPYVQEAHAYSRPVAPKRMIVL